MILRLGNEMITVNHVRTFPLEIAGLPAPYHLPEKGGDTGIDVAVGRIVLPVSQGLRKFHATHPLPDPVGGKHVCLLLPIR